MGIKHLLDNKVCKWKMLFLQLSKLNKSDLLCKYSIEYISKECSPFYCQVLKYWFELYSTEPSSTLTLQEHIWKNKFIQINGEPVCTDYTQWQIAGINKLKDIADTNRKFYSAADIKFTHGFS